MWPRKARNWAVFGDSSSKAALLTIYFGAFRPVRLQRLQAEIDPDESPADLHQWLSCVSLVRSPDEAFHFLRLFVGRFDSFVRIKCKADGNPILTVEPRTPPSTASICQLWKDFYENKTLLGQRLFRERK